MKKFLSIILTCALAVAFSGCIGNQVTSKGEYVPFIMHTDAKFAVFDNFTVQKNVRKFDSFKEEVLALLNDIENSLSVTKSTSYVTEFNNAQAGETVQLDKHTYNVLKIAYDMYVFTEGYYNPAVYYSVQAYGFNDSAKTPSSAAELPSAEDVAKYVELSTHFAELSLYEEDGKFYAVKPRYTVEVDGQALSLKVDLGGIGKGYTADLVDDLFDEYGYTMGYFVFGSSSIACKKYADGANFNLSGTDPRCDYLTDADDTYFKVNVSNTSLSSSGDYENFYYLDTDGDGKEELLCHVFDPHTGKPVNTGVMCATVIGGSAADNDALTTAIMAMGAQKAIKFINSKIPEKQVIFACDGGAKGYTYYTNMAEGSYEITDSKYSPFAPGE